MTLPIIVDLKTKQILINTNGTLILPGEPALEIPKVNPYLAGIIMKTKGIRISDIKNGKCIPLFELLEGIPCTCHLHWALLWCDVTPVQGKGKQIIELQKLINESLDGVSFTFKSLVNFSEQIFQEIEILIIGCESKNDIHRYEEDREMYENCNTVIEMIDGGFWEIFSKNINWIEELSKKYKEVEFINSDGTPWLPIK